MILLDTNLLTRLTRTDHPHGSIARHACRSPNRQRALRASRSARREFSTRHVMVSIGMRSRARTAPSRSKAGRRALPQFQSA